MWVRMGALLMGSAMLVACSTIDPESEDRSGGNRQTMTTATQVDCGTHVRKPLDVLPMKAISCLVTGANSGQRVHLRVQSVTDEGDPIVETYESPTTGIVTVATDYTKDKFGSGQIEYMTCTGPNVVDGRLRFEKCS